MPTLTEKLPAVQFDKSRLEIPKYIDLADEHFNSPKQIDILLGAEIFYTLMESGKLRLGNTLPVLQETRLGRIISGSLALMESRVPKTVCNLHISNKVLNDSLTKFWQVEEFGHTKFYSKAEQYCEDFFQKTTTREIDGSFNVRYPFKQDVPLVLGNSKNQALKRFVSLEKRLSNNPTLKTQYVDFMREYERLGGHKTFLITLENDHSIPSFSYFLPHTAVLRDSVTTKCRVVFDASCKTGSGVSLNDMLIAGPTVQEDLYSILLRLRLHKVVLSADVKMMYRCIKINEDERIFQKILRRWNSEESVKVFSLNTVTYGTTSAPFQATRCLVEIANENEIQYPQAAKVIRQAFYMDDLLLSVNSETEAVKIYRDLTKILGQANFHLRKWSSNSKEFLEVLLKENNYRNEDNFILSHKDKQLKTLGIAWDPETDVLKYCINVNVNISEITKRTILSTISQIFDPLGLVGPAIIQAKLLIQALWKLDLGWDQDIPPDLKQIWLDYSSQIELLNKIQINRQVLISDCVSVELHGFCDSSERAYGACIYVCSVDSSGNKDVRLLTAKSRVAPVKKLTLPRLELLAAHLLAELMTAIRKILDIHVSQITYYTDSTIVLSWIRIEPCNLKTFVANRIAKIIENSNPDDWKHVVSQANPADVISRGLNPKDLLICNIWFYSPEFLKSEKMYCDVTEEILTNKLPDLKTCVTITNAATSDTQDFKIFERFSSFHKLRRVVAYICRFKNEL